MDKLVKLEPKTCVDRHIEEPHPYTHLERRFLYATDPLLPRPLTKQTSLPGSFDLPPNFTLSSTLG